MKKIINKLKKFYEENWSTSLKLHKKISLENSFLFLLQFCSLEFSFVTVSWISFYCCTCYCYDLFLFYLLLLVAKRFFLPLPIIFSLGYTPCWNFYYSELTSDFFMIHFWKIGDWKIIIICTPPEFLRNLASKSLSQKRFSKFVGIVSRKENKTSLSATKSKLHFYKNSVFVLVCL